MVGVHWSRHRDGSLGSLESRIIPLAHSDHDFCSYLLVCLGDFDSQFGKVDRQMSRNGAFESNAGVHDNDQIPLGHSGRGGRPGLRFFLRRRHQYRQLYSNRPGTLLRDLN